MPKILGKSKKKVPENPDNFQKNQKIFGLNQELLEKIQKILGKSRKFLENPKNSWKIKFFFEKTRKFLGLTGNY